MVFLPGTAFDDVLRGGAGRDTLDGRAGDDTLLGLAGRDLLLGGPDNDTLIGGTGNDTMLGGEGQDVASWNDGGLRGVRVDLTLGRARRDGETDRVDGVEILILTRGADHFVGVAVEDEVDTGFFVGQTVEGLAGNDTMLGSRGGDRLFGGDGDDTLDGGGETFELDVLDGGAGNDVLRNAEVASGGPGRDKIHVFGFDGSFADGGEGNDAIVAGGTLPVVTGGSGNDRIEIVGAFDGAEIYGGDGDDFIRGGEHGDLIVGGRGRDVMAGGDGPDIFLIADGDTGNAALQRDKIKEFEPGNELEPGDLIDLSAIDANVLLPGDQAFVFIGDAEFTAPGQLRFYRGGSDRFLQGSTDGDRSPEFTIELDKIGTDPRAEWIVL